jgi:WhiB family redox-sensing transcriptional regulator
VVELLRDPYIPAIENAQWFLEANCKDEPPETMYPDTQSLAGRLEEQHAIDTFCAHCPVKSDCFDNALLQNDEWGIKGGLSESSRRALHKQFKKTGQLIADYTIRKGKEPQRLRPRSSLEYVPAAYQRLSKAALRACARSPFDRDDIQALNILSQGFMLGEVPPYDEYDNSTQQSVRNRLYSGLELSNIAGWQGPAFAVRRSIELKLLPIAFASEPPIEIASPEDQVILEFVSLNTPSYHISSLLGLPESTVKSRRGVIQRQLKARNSAHAVRRAYETGTFIFDPAGTEKIRQRRMALRKS